MQKTFTAFILTTLFACNEHYPKNNPSTSANDTSKISEVSNNNSLDNTLPGKQYNFDSSAFVNGCADVYLQKISKDLENELLIELKFDSIPKFKEIDISKYSNFIHVYFNKYSKGNEYVDQICNDVKYFSKDWKQPNKYSAVAGNLTITYWSEKEAVVSALTKNLVLEDSAKNKINIPHEIFDKLRVHWIGG